MGELQCRCMGQRHRSQRIRCFHLVHTPWILHELTRNKGSEKAHSGTQERRLGVLAAIVCFHVATFCDE